MADIREFPGAERPISGRPKIRRYLIGAIVLAILLSARSTSTYVIEYGWWKEMGQLDTWFSMLLYGVLPMIVATLLTFAVLWITHARALKYAGTGLREHRFYALISTVFLLLISMFIAGGAMDSWTFVRYWGALNMGPDASTWRDPIFGRALPFYFFDLPFYSQVLGLLSALSFVAALIFLVASRAWALRHEVARWREQREVEFSDLGLGAVLHSPLFHILVAVFLLTRAGAAYLERYDYLQATHGFLVGIDYLNHQVHLPLQYVAVGAFILAAVFVMLRRWKWVAFAIAIVVIRNVIPPIVSAAYVRPNELALQKPYIVHHIQATRSAFALEGRVQETQFPAKLESPINGPKNKPLLDNVRLWDWRAFHDTVTQLQALRQYYVFQDTDVDRYKIDGQIRQVMLTPRELDIRQLPDARTNWINGHFIYTHGYGVVMAEANKITANGQPVLFVHDAPPKVESSSLKLTRPEIYYGEVTHEPVFVATQQAEFNYPSGNENVQTRYSGKGGIPLSGFGMRLAAALHYTDRNILLTGYLTDQSRMLIRRDVKGRLNALAPFLRWDPDPYLVLTDEGRLVWMVDGYTTSVRHPYATRVSLGDMGTVNYIRNPIKATVDAYDGSVSLYVFDASDPLIGAWRAVFPTLFKPSSEMPADLRTHVRHPELMFRAQTEVYRSVHMRDAEAFYNKEDLWDIAKTVYSQSGKPEGAPPVYVVATLPGETEPEFLLMQSFTPRSKDNLIGVMAARCDRENLGKIVVLQLSKQSLIYGPLQIESRIDSDQNISKDLSLWNQQGSQVLRGQMLVLPIDETFLYIEPIYIQAQQARMPQLKKVVAAMGNQLAYRDTYDQAIADLLSGAAATGGPATTSTVTEAPPGTRPQAAAVTASAPPAPAATSDARVEAVRRHLQRYRDLTAKGQWAEAGRELEALERAVR